MTKKTELLDSIDNFISALSYTHHFDERELFELAAAMCQARAKRLASLDPKRNQ